MNDEEFLGYVRLHSQTERHAFTREQAERLFQLAGVFPKGLLTLDVVMGPGRRLAEDAVIRIPFDVAEDLVNKARARITTAPLAAAQGVTDGEPQEEAPEE